MQVELTDITIEAAALEVLRGSSQRSLPVDLEKVAEEHSITLVAKPRDAAGVSGMLLKQGDNFAIIYNTNIDNSGYQRFSIAHEFGHYFLPGHIDGLLSEQDVHISGSTNSRYEKEADKFAANLLMPKSLLPSWVRKSTPTLGQIVKLADLCDVSVEASALRVLSLTGTPMAVARLDNGVIEYCMMSGAFKQIENLVWIKGGKDAPRDAVSSAFSRDQARVLGKEIDQDISCLSVWFGAEYEHPLKESVIGLGSYGKCLAILQCDFREDMDLVSAEEEEEEAREKIRW